jgi:uncharacterized protein (DUF2147 family)
MYLILMLVWLPGLVVAQTTQAQVTGLWQVADEKDGVVKSIVEIYEKDNTYYGRVKEVLKTSRRTHCENCTGDLKDKPLTGMIIMYDVKKSRSGGTDGKVLNPATGNMYSCYIDLVSEDKLKLRGYIGLPAFGKTMYWERLRLE